ncbi:MAG: 16S rRNA (adenine(1518)-N(6)/adenine(1519)-N(6))-dimethyltransferase RsmA [Ignisphaera sp.]
MKELNTLNHGRTLPNSRKELISWMKAKLRKYGIRLRRRLSQIVLIDPKILSFIAKKSSELIPCRDTATILEIGAGIGNLTQFLGSENGNALIIAVEIDHRFAPILQEIKRVYSNVEIVIGDALTLLESIRGIDLVTGNIPYHITSHLLLAIARSDIPFALLTIQKDVAERIVSKPGTKNYGKLSILMQLLFDVEILKVVPPVLFVPHPQVSSSIIVLKRKRLYDRYVETIEELTKCLFSYKRKLVIKAFEYCLGKKLNEKIKVEGSIWRKRVAHLTIEDIMELANIYVKLRTEN